MHAELLVIGGGAAGLSAAHTGARLRRRTVLVVDGPIGGDCTFTGCVPSKTLIEAAAAGLPFAAAIARVRDTVARIAATETADALRAQGVEVVTGRACFVDAHTVTVGGQRIAAGRVVIATGSHPLLPPIDGLTEVAALTSDTVWDLGDAPRSLAVVGGGAVGCELAQAFARFGTAVTVVEAAPRLLAKEEPAASQVIAAAFAREGIDVRLGVQAERAERAIGGVRLHLDDGSQVAAAAVLVAVGRAPVTDGLAAEAAGIRLDGRGYIRTDERMATTAAGVYAAGDVTGRLPFTHAADEMGRVAASNALRWPRRARFHQASVPWVTFTDPEVARVGMTETQAAAHGGRVAHLPLDAVDRALAAGRPDGFIRLIAGPRPLTRHLAGGQLLGATIVAPRAGEMIHEVALAMRAGMVTGRLAQTVHAYPTWSTGLRAAAAQFFFDVDGRRARPAGRGDDGKER